MSERSATDELREEHRSAILQMSQLEAALGSLAGPVQGVAAEVKSSIKARIESLRGHLFLHFRKEEEGLYPEVQRMVAEGAPRVDILTQFFSQAADSDLTAHHLLRVRLREMQELAEGIERCTGEAGGRAPAGPVETLRSLVSTSFDLLTRHIEKEDGLVFPMIERLLEPAQMEAAAARMREISRQPA